MDRRNNIFPESAQIKPQPHHGRCLPSSWKCQTTITGERLWAAAAASGHQCRRSHDIRVESGAGVSPADRGREGSSQWRTWNKLLKIMHKYTSGGLTAAEIIAELVEFAKTVSAERGNAKEMGLSDDEYAFYTAVAQNQSAKDILGDETLSKIACEIVKELEHLPVDWWIREQAQAAVRSKVKRLLARYGYPPDARPEAVELVLRQTRTYIEDQA